MKRTPGKTAEARDKHWTRIIEAARHPAGVTAYCRFMNVSKNNYYFWFKRLRPAHPEWHDLTNSPEILSSNRKPQLAQKVNGAQPETEVPLNSRRRKWSLVDKARILEETDNAEPGALGSILRREGIYVHTLNKWRTARDLLDMSQRKKIRVPRDTAG
jgi:hypothetical protein